jgi:hypothetical protein
MAGVVDQREIVEQHPKPEIGYPDADPPGGRVPPWLFHGQLRPPVDQGQLQIGRAAAVALGTRLLRAANGHWNPARSRATVALAGIVTFQLWAASSDLARVTRWTSRPP